MADCINLRDALSAICKMRCGEHHAAESNCIQRENIAWSAVLTQSTHCIRWTGFVRLGNKMEGFEYETNKQRGNTMVNLIIKKMEMPESCRGCQFMKIGVGDWKGEFWCSAARLQPLTNIDIRPNWCPLAPVSVWIPADKPPKPGERVLLRAGVFVGEGYYTSAHTWYRFTGMPMRDITDEPVTEWMPLPEVPE